MLLKTSEIISNTKLPSKEKKTAKPDPEVINHSGSDSQFVDDMDQILTKTINKIQQGINIHYYSFANFNLVRLILHIIKQTGPVHLFMTSYTFSAKSVAAVNRHLEDKKLLSFKVLIDNRVRTVSPKPFQMITQSFDYRCSSVHAKIALIWNETWKISIVTSQNATDNPKMERGIIFTDPVIFDYDYKALSNEYNRGNL